ncbi:MAG: hypothetical protein WC647_02535 [Desulfomonilaceae bacterium]|jgi:hypothetical protein
MNYRKSLILALILGLSIVLLAGPASAWEFSMDGTYTWQLEMRGQLGSSGFFGQYDQANDETNSGFGPGGFAPYNFYLGGFHKVAGTGSTSFTTVGTGQPLPYAAVYGGQGTSLAGGESIVSGSDASWNIIYMSTNMQIRMNKAVRIRGNYFVGSWNSPNYSTSQGLMVSSGMLNQDAAGVQRSFSPGYWRTLWLSAQLPWGEITVGKRPSSWGMGLAYNGEDNRHSDSLALSVPYGPLRIQLSFYPSRRGYGSDDYSTASAWYNERPDKNNTRVFDLTIPNVTYNAGPVSAGFILNWVFRHRGKEGVIAAPATRWAANQFSTDFGEQYGGAYFKYNNGRFFLNAEYSFDRITDQRNYSANSIPTAPPAYTVHDSGAVELGTLCGPAKVSLIGAWFTGDDYRGSTLNGANRMVKVTSGLQSDTWSNTGVFRPYSYLMVYGYGLGSSFARDTGNGFVQDATFYGARLDYAAAANLNLFGSFAWAERFSQSGFLWGCLRPATNSNTAGVLTVATTTAPGLGGATSTGTQPYAGQVVLNNYSPNGGNRIPTIPDGALGYEIDAGFDWKLLEGLTARCTFGYWVPGKWWSYACVDKSVNNWATWGGSLNGDAFRTNPGKTIDPVWGSEFKLEGTF